MFDRMQSRGWNTGPNSIFTPRGGNPAPTLGELAATYTGPLRDDLENAAYATREGMQDLRDVAGDFRGADAVRAAADKLRGGAGGAQQTLGFQPGYGVGGYHPMAVGAGLVGNEIAGGFLPQQMMLQRAAETGLPMMPPEYFQPGVGYGSPYGPGAADQYVSEAAAQANEAAMAAAHGAGDPSAPAEAPVEVLPDGSVREVGADVQTAVDEVVEQVRDEAPAGSAAAALADAAAGADQAVDQVADDAAEQVADSVADTAAAAARRSGSLIPPEVMAHPAVRALHDDILETMRNLPKYLPRV